MVTLSSRGLALESSRMWRRMVRNRPKPNPVGLIIEINEPKYEWDQNRKYIIKWITDGPSSRESYGYGYTRRHGHWHRSDLKWVAKAK